MKKPFLLTFFAVAVCGCAPSQNAASTPDPNAGMTAQEKIEKIQADPKIPDGLKQIQSESLSRESQMNGGSR